MVKNPEKFAWIGKFVNGEAEAHLRNGDRVVIDEKSGEISRVVQSSRFKKIGEFSEGYAFAEISDGGIVIINTDGEISKVINSEGKKVNKVFRYMDARYNSSRSYIVGISRYMNDNIGTNFHKGFATIKGDKDSTIFITRSGYAISGLQSEDRELLESFYDNPEKFFELKVRMKETRDRDGKVKKVPVLYPVSDLEGLRGLLDIVQAGMENRVRDLSDFSDKKEISRAIKFADKVKKHFEKLKKNFGLSLGDICREKIGALGE